MSAVDVAVDDGDLHTHTVGQFTDTREEAAAIELVEGDGRQLEDYVSFGTSDRKIPTGNRPVAVLGHYDKCLQPFPPPGKQPLATPTTSRNVLHAKLLLEIDDGCDRLAFDPLCCKAPDRDASLASGSD